MRRREVVEVAEDENGTKSETMTLTLFINFSYFSERPPAIASCIIRHGRWMNEALVLERGAGQADEVQQ